MNRAERFPPPPEELQDREVKIEYMSILASTQKQAAYSGIEILMNTAGALAQIQAGAGRQPDVLDKLDCDEIIDQLADMYVIPSGIVLGDDAVAEKRAQRQEAEAQAQQEQQAMMAMQAGAQAAPQLAKAGKDLSETQMPGGGNGLEQIAGMMGSEQQLE